MGNQHLNVYFRINPIYVDEDPVGTSLGGVKDNKIRRSEDFIKQVGNFDEACVGSNNPITYGFEKPELKNNSIKVCIHKTRSKHKATPATSLQWGGQLEKK